MKKFLLATIFLSFFCFFAHAEFGISSSAVCMNINGTSAFYNTQNTAGSATLSKLNFGGNLGAFGNNSGNLKIIGAAINTFKNSNGNVCGGILYYTVYPQGGRPDTPAFSSVNLGLYSKAATTEQWQGLDNAIDLTANAIGDYTLEIYYGASGSDLSANCSQQKLDNSSGANYTADFSITLPLALNFTSFYGIAGDKSIEIRWATQNDVNIVSYEIQKSDNGLNFTTIATMDSKRSAAGGNYYFNDDTPFIASNYYRIKADNYNSTVNLTNVVRLYFDIVANSILIYPNPTGNVLVARLAGINPGTYQLSVLSSGGQQILTMPLVHNAADETLHINLPVTLSHGVYQLFLIDKIQFYKQAFMVE